LELIAKLIEFINSLNIGTDVYAAQAQAVASIMNEAIGGSFYITSFKLGFTASPSGASNLTINFNQAAVTDSAKINLTVT
jgi:hypothetical protein